MSDWPWGQRIRLFTHSFSLHWWLSGNTEDDGAILSRCHGGKHGRQPSMEDSGSPSCPQESLLYTFHLRIFPSNRKESTIGVEGWGVCALRWRQCPPVWRIRGQTKGGIKSQSNCISGQTTVKMTRGGTLPRLIRWNPVDCGHLQKG